MSMFSLVRGARRSIAGDLAVWFAAVVAPCAVAQNAGPAAAQGRVDVELRAGAVRSDNVARLPSGGEEGTIWALGFGLDVDRHTRRLKLLARGDMDWMRYPGGTFNDDVLGQMNALADLSLVPQTVNWIFEETYSQVRSDPIAAVTPDNLEGINYFTTGPDFTFRPGNTTSVRLSGRYSTTTSGANDLDGDRYQGSAALIRELGGKSSLSLQANAARLAYKDNGDTADFTNYEGFGRYETQGSRTRFNADVGYTLLDRANDSSGGALARLSLTRKLSPATQLYVAAAKQFSDASAQLRDSLQRPASASTAQPGAVLADNDPFENRFVSVNWEYNRDRTNLNISVERGREIHENSGALDRTSTAYAAYFQRRLAPHLRLRLDARRTDQSYESNFRDRDLQAGATLGWAIGSTLELAARYNRLDRDSSIALAQYTENQVSLFVNWTPLARR